MAAPADDIPQATIGLIGLGDPALRQTWSGTPWQIRRALLEVPGINVRTLDADIPSGLGRRLLQVIAALQYRQTCDLGRGTLFRAVRARKVSKALPPGSCDCRLHFGTLTFPKAASDKTQKDYIFCDATWNTWSQYASSMSRYRPKLNAEADRLEGYSYEQAEHIFAISEYVRDNLISHYRVPQNKVSVVGTGLGVIEPFYGPKDYSNGKILFVAKGRFEDKGGHLVLSAFARAKRANPNLTLTIVGQSHYPDQYGSVPGIETFGFVSLEKLQELFNTHSLFVMPAKNEPWGLVYLEALACRMPIVGLRANAFPELSQDGKVGIILENETPDSLAEALLNAFQSPEILEAKGHAGQSYCLERFTWKQTAARMLDVMLEGRTVK